MKYNEWEGYITLYGAVTLPEVATQKEAAIALAEVMSDEYHIAIEPESIEGIKNTDWYEKDDIPLYTPKRIAKLASDPINIVKYIRGTPILDIYEVNGKTVCTEAIEGTIFGVRY